MQQISIVWHRSILQTKVNSENKKKIVNKKNVHFPRAIIAHSLDECFIA